MAITADLVKDLRAKTGVGMMDCKEALQASNGDIEKAIEWLRKKGLASAGKRAGRTASQGVVDAYIHGGGTLGVLVEVNSETDFVARNEEFRKLVHDVAIHIAAADPQYVTREDVPAEVVAREREIAREQLAKQMAGKPAIAIDKALEGKLNKWFEGVVLLEQPFVRDDKKKVGDIIMEAISKMGENIVVRRFVRFKLGDSP
ncbi:MAG: translation elongation factor Ts [Armatimonadetes bacterium]|nr:translation elongation factor Ts [Armatimonadota bacterium]